MKRQIIFYSTLLCFFLLNAFVLLTSSSLGNHRCHHDERLALLQFKELFNTNASINASSICGQHSHPKMTSWNASTDCCTWDGVRCEGITGHVIGLRLSCSRLQGILRPNSSLFRLSHLKRLNLAYNDFTGSQISHEFGSLRSLTYLNLSHSNFQGEIAPEISHLSNLNFLDLSGNTQCSMGPCSYAEHRPCTFQAMLQNLTQLHVLSLASVNISSEVRVNFSSPKLAHLDLCSSGIYGNLPRFHLPNIKILLLRGNNLSGSLMDLDTSSNLLQGQLPSSLCNLSRLSILDLSHNRFISAIPQCFGNLSKQLYLLNLANNTFFDSIPEPCSKGNSLNFLILKNNQLEGPLPQSLANCTELKLLDLENNKIDDKFPMWLETLPDLRVLILTTNRFHGAIGNFKTTSPFPKLRIIDLSYNKLTGVLPIELFSNFKAMMSSEADPLGDRYMHFKSDNLNYYIHSVCLKLKGVKYEFEKILMALTAIDFSNNRLEGEIPKSIGELHSLQILDLSNNSISGHIPLEFGNLNMLESLDLSWNQLEGAIPEQLLNLTFLGFLNLSKNHLVGCIPRGRHFDTFENNSYGGNPALCGFPLTKDCGDSAPSPSMGFDEEYDSNFFDGFTWKPVLLGYCFGLVLGLSTGCIMFKTGKPRWFIQIVEEMCELQKSPRKWFRMRINNSVRMQESSDRVGIMKARQQNQVQVLLYLK